MKTRINEKQNSAKVMKFITVIIIGLIFNNPAAFGQQSKMLEIVNLKSKPIVKGVLNGKTAYFLLDTGSDLTILNIKSARKYGFDLIQGRNKVLMIEGLGGSHRDFKRAIGLKLYMDQSLIYTYFFAFDLTNIVNSLRRNTGIKIVGIIGSDVMRKYGFKIDYHNKFISFTSIEPGKKQNEEVKELVLSSNK